jgi:hypothetical protein
MPACLGAFTWFRSFAPKGQEGRAVPQQTQDHKNPEAVSRLNPEQYRVTQQDGTERPFANAYWDNHEPGIYVDVGSGAAVRIGRQVRQQLRLAELHEADRQDERRRARRLQPRDDPDRGPVAARGQPPRPRLQRRSRRQGWTALLHQLCVVAVHPPRRPGERRVWRIPHPVHE